MHVQLSCYSCNYTFLKSFKMWTFDSSFPHPVCLCLFFPRCSFPLQFECDNWMVPSGVANRICWLWTTNLFLKFQFNCCLQTGKFEGRKVFEYQAKIDLLNGPVTQEACKRFKEYWMMYYSFRDLELLCWKWKTLW